MQFYLHLWWHFAFDGPCCAKQSPLLRFLLWTTSTLTSKLCKPITIGKEFLVFENTWFFRCWESNKSKPLQCCCNAASERKSKQSQIRPRPCLWSVSAVWVGRCWELWAKDKGKHYHLLLKLFLCIAPGWNRGLIWTRIGGRALAMSISVTSRYVDLLLR